MTNVEIRMTKGTRGGGFAVGTDLRESGTPSSDSERSPIVGVSRRFGVGHMLVATGLFAIVFGFLQYADASLATYALWAFFCTAIPLGQVFLYQGRDPRRASCLVGSRLLPALRLSSWIYLLAKEAMEGRWTTLDLSLAAEGTLFIALMTILSMALGYGLGYMIGTISAGVFLVLDRRWDAGKRVDVAGIRHQLGATRLRLLLRLANGGWTGSPGRLCGGSGGTDSDPFVTRSFCHVSLLYLSPSASRSSGAASFSRPI